MKPPGCLRQFSFPCLPKLLALFFLSFSVKLFFSSNVFLFRLVGFMTLFYVGHSMSKKEGGWTSRSFSPRSMRNDDVEDL
jgi:hypothetical protein